MKFIGKNSLKDYVSAEEALKCWGGQNDYEFEFVPENREIKEVERKKVHFADRSPELKPFPESSSSSSLTHKVCRLTYVIS